MGLVLSTQTLMAQVPSYVPTDGLVGYWPFNGNANDESGNGNNGTLVGSPNFITDRFGNQNSSFQGGTTYITCPSSVFQFSMTENFSVSVWFTKSTINGRLISTENPEGNFRISKNNSVDLSVQFGDFLNFNIDDNNWHHLVYTYQNRNEKIYIDGVLVSTNFDNSTGTLNYGSPFTIGAKAAPSFDRWNGKIDDIGVWNRVLTQQEITNLFNSSLPQNACLPANIPTTGLVGYWPFCDNANDESGNGNNGVIEGNVQATTDRFGNSNSAFLWQSANTNNYINIGDINSQLSNKITISAWVLMNCSLPNQRIISTGEQGIIIYQIQGNNIILKASYDPAGSIWPSNHLISKDEWHHVVFTADNEQNISRLYVDGVLTDTNLGASGNQSNALWNIGRKSISAFDGFCGKIDDIGIWNRALTQEEITNLYNANQCITNITVTDTLIINVGQLSFNDPVEWANNITIAPNPASTEVNINFNNITDLVGGSINIINSLGQSVATTPITATGTQNTMQLAAWGGTGMYFVQIINPQGIVVDVKKIILQ